MTGSRKVCAALLTACVLMWTTSAWADPTQQEKERARDLMAEGRDKRDNKSDMAGALESFRQADAIMHVPTTGYEVAKAQQALGQLLEARETVAAVLKLPVSVNDPAPFSEARAKSDALGKELDKLIPQLKIAVKLGDPKLVATVTVDDAPLASLDTPARVNPGKHVVAAKADGVPDALQEITIAAGETKDVELRLEKPGSSAPPPPPPRKGLPTLSLIGFGVGAAGLAVGTVTGIMAMSAEGDIGDRCQGTRCGRDVQDDLDSAKTKATISTIGFIVAGVGVAVGVVGFFITPKTEAKVGQVTVDFTRLRATF